VKRLLTLALPLFVCAPAFGIDLDPKFERAIHDALPVCEGAKVSFEELPLKLPPRFTGTFVKVQSASGHCNSQIVAVLSPAGRVYLGSPWVIEKAEGATLEARLQNFTLANLQEQMTAKVERTRTVDGLYPATLTQTTEAGKMTIDGEIDGDGRVFFLGHFRPAAELRASRAKTFDPFLASSPSKGAAAGAPVTIVEFSDFQCPSCKRSSGYVDPILAKHGDKVRYIRYDLPLTGHAWAFPAALAGRAIYRQNPELFWTYKKQVYENQEGMIAFTFWDWARGFAEDHELDLAKYDADLANETLRAEILRGAGVALSNDIRSTPSYLVNGALVEAGTDGKALAEYVEKLVTK